MSSAPLLAGLRVVEVSAGYSGRLSGKLLAELGATVTRLAPVADSGAALAAYLDGAKEVWRTGPESEEVASLLEAAQAAIIESASGEEAAELAGRLSTRYPSLVIVTVTPFGTEWPYRRWRAADAQAAAFGGLTSHVGDPDTEPLTPPAWQAEFQAGLQAAIGVLIGLATPHSGGRAAHLDLATVEAVATFLVGYEVLPYAFLGSVPVRSGPRTRGYYPYGILRCKDGHVSLLALQRAEWERFLEMIGNPDWASNPRYQDRVRMSLEYPDEVDALIEEWLATRSKWEVFELARQHRVPAVPVLTPEEVQQSEHLAARGFFTQIGGQPMPSVPISVDGERASLRQVPEVAAKRTNKTRIDRVRVLDFGWVWAGAILGQVFADLGAEVIKVESLQRLDPMRRGRPVVGERPDPNQNLMFHNTNRGKRSLGLNLKHAQAREVVLELVRQSDVLVENMSVGAMARLGLDHETLREVNPRLIYVSMPGLGTGPWSDVVTYGPTITGLCGMDSATRYPDGRVVGIQQAVVDPTAGLVATFAALAALCRRDVTGEGGHIEVPLIEVGAFMMAPAFAGPLDSGPGGCDCMVRAGGVDEWVSVRLDGDVAGSLKKLAIEISDATEIGSALAEWMRRRPADDAARALQRVGVAAAPVLNAADRIGHPLYALRETHRRIENAVLGPEILYGSPWHFYGRQAPALRSAPQLGEHNFQLAEEILGFDPARVAALTEAGLFEEEISGRLV